MAYEKQNFIPGQKLKAAELNHMEDGIVNAVSVTEQTLSEAQKSQARKNLDIDDIAGAHIGPEAPTNGEKLWIDTDEEAEEGAQLDGPAAVGQVFIVTEVDENGKPTKYKWVDLPKAETPDWNANEGEKGYIEGRTHYVDEKGIVHKLPNMFIDADWMATKQDGGAGKTVFIPEQTVSGGLWKNLQADLVEGTAYAVEVNGVLYKCVCKVFDEQPYLGNGSLWGDTATEHNNEPFAIVQGLLGATTGTLYEDGTLSDPIGIKVTNWQNVVYNKLPEEYLPENVVKGEGGKVAWDNVSDKPFSQDAGELLFSHTATFATDEAATAGSRITNVSVTLHGGSEYWLELNGEMLKCICEKVGTASWEFRDVAGNMWLKRYLATNMYVYGQTAGTYTYKLYGLSEDIVLDPKYIPNSIARKSDIPEAGGAGVDVTASVGQTIIVEEVDASGKPTKWKAVEYQPRTHWTGECVLYEGTHEESENGEFLLDSTPDFTVGKTYKIICNGVEYSCVAVDATDTLGGVALGNVDLLLESGDTGEPFALLAVDGIVAGVLLDGSTSVTLSIVGEMAIPIPAQYLTNALPYYIEATGEWVSNTSSEYSTNETVAALTAVLQTGRDIILRVNEETDMNGTRNTMFYRLATIAQDNSGMLAFYSSVGVGLILTPTTDGTYSISAFGLGAKL